MTMLVGERMTRNPVTITEDTSIDDALHLMRERKVRRLPILDKVGHLVGIVSDKDLLHAAPSPASTLSVYEMHYLLAKLTVKKVMSSPVITVGPDTPVEVAARIMADNKIGGLPVLDGGNLVGIITETDIFKILIELLGARTPGLRVTVSLPDRKGNLAKLTQALADRSANIISLVTYAGLTASECLITIKVNEVDETAVREALNQPGVTVVDLRGA
jgi:acetoin utilization protein AcuB